MYFHKKKLKNQHIIYVHILYTTYKIQIELYPFDNVI